MKKSVLLIFSIMFMLFVTNIFSQTLAETEDAAKHAAALKKPFCGVCCEDETIRLDCVCKIGNMKSEKALLTLMRVLREDPCEEVRIAAAHSLVRIGDPRGVYLVSRLAKFSDSERLSRLCTKFYKAYQYQEYLVKQGIEEQDENGLALTSLEE